MRLSGFLVVFIALVVTSCELPPDAQFLPPTAVSQTVQAAVATAQATMRVPTPTTTWTPIYVPTATSIATATPRPSATTPPTVPPAASATITPTRPITPTLTLVFTPTVPPVATPISASSILSPTLTTTLFGCNLGLDILRGLGEVTNAYVRVRNTGGADLTNVCLTFNASNEGKPHPDKSHCFAALRPNYEVTTKLTVDTQSGMTNNFQITTTTNQGLTTTLSTASCVAPDPNTLAKINLILNTPQPITSP